MSSTSLLMSADSSLSVASNAGILRNSCRCSSTKFCNRVFLLRDKRGSRTSRFTRDNCDDRTAGCCRKFVKQELLAGGHTNGRVGGSILLADSRQAQRCRSGSHTHRHLYLQEGVKRRRVTQR